MLVLLEIRKEEGEDCKQTSVSWGLDDGNHVLSTGEDRNLEWSARCCARGADRRRRPESDRGLVLNAQPRQR